jgi:hypothetical protein
MRTQPTKSLLLTLSLAGLAAAASARTNAPTDTDGGQTDTLNDMRVAKVDRFEVRGPSGLHTNKAAVLMFLHDRRHYVVRIGTRFEPLHGQKFQVLDILGDDSVVLTGPTGGRVSVQPVTEEEREEYVRRFFPEKAAPPKGGGDRDGE